MTIYNHIEIEMQLLPIATPHNIPYNLTNEKIYIYERINHGNNAKYKCVNYAKKSTEDTRSLHHSKGTANDKIKRVFFRKNKELCFFLEYNDKEDS